MDNWLKTLIAAACMVVIAGGGYYAWSKYQENQRSTSLSQNREDSRRVESLAADRCFKIVNDVVAEHAKQPITQPSQVSDATAHDLGLCIRRVDMGDFTKNELEKTGLWQVFGNS